MSLDGARILLIDGDDSRREVLAQRLRAQGCSVESFGSPEEGATAALSYPPDGVVADLWMPGISGVQLCRLLRAEPATADVPVILRATTDGARDKFWARKAGASGFVAKGRMGELVRALERTVKRHNDPFFFQLGQDVDIRARMAHHLDRALFELVLSNELRGLGAIGSFDRMMDKLAQLVCQVTTYRWMALETSSRQLGVHCRPENAARSVAEAIEATHADPEDIVRIEDDDAAPDPPGEFDRPFVADATFGSERYGTVAFMPVPGSEVDQEFVQLIARELAGALRMLSLVEETRRLAATDPLTALLRRAAFVERLTDRLGPIRDAGGSVTLMVIDVDFFKAINDTLGHAAGDAVLTALGSEIQQFATAGAGWAARWGGEEFVVALPRVDPAAALTVAEDLRARIAARSVSVSSGDPVRVTASIGVSQIPPTGLVSLEQAIDRADLAMYQSKTRGRNRVTAA